MTAWLTVFRLLWIIMMRTERIAKKKQKRKNKTEKKEISKENMMTIVNLMLLSVVIVTAFLVDFHGGPKLTRTGKKIIFCLHKWKLLVLHNKKDAYVCMHVCVCVCACEILFYKLLIELSLTLLKYLQ